MAELRVCTWRSDPKDDLCSTSSLQYKAWIGTSTDQSNLDPWTIQMIPERERREPLANHRCSKQSAALALPGVWYKWTVWGFTPDMPRQTCILTKPPVVFGQRWRSATPKPHLNTDINNRSQNIAMFDFYCLHIKIMLIFLCVSGIKQTLSVTGQTVNILSFEGYGLGYYSALLWLYKSGPRR